MQSCSQRFGIQLPPACQHTPVFAIGLQNGTAGVQCKVLMHTQFIMHSSNHSHQRLKKWSTEAEMQNEKDTHV